MDYSFYDFIFCMGEIMCSFSSNQSTFFLQKPKKIPNRAFFSCGPCVKRKDWSVLDLQNALISVSHRNKLSQEKISQLIQLMRKLLKIPSDYIVAIVPGSSTGAFESLLWSLLGKENNVNVIANCFFSRQWLNDVQNELKLHVNIFNHYTELLLLDKQKTDVDTVFCLTSTTTGTCVNSLDWIGNDRENLIIADCTSTVFCEQINWLKLDGTAFSWQKGMGSEAGLGTIVLSPRAQNRLQTYVPNWPIPQLFRLAKNMKIENVIVNGSVKNTPSMLIIEEALCNLLYIENLGGVDVLCQKICQNYNVIKKCLKNQNLIDFSEENEVFRAKNIAKLTIKHEAYLSLNNEEKWKVFERIIDRICENFPVFDVIGHRQESPGIRLWCGYTQEKDDIECFLEWVIWSVMVEFDDYA